VEKKTISAHDLLDKLKSGESVFLLDVRDEEKFRSGSLEHDGATPVNIPYVAMKDDQDSIRDQVAELPKDKIIVTLCTTGNKAQKAAQLLCEKGFSAVSIEGGLTAWNELSK